MGIFNEHSSSSSFTTGGFRTVPLQGAAGPQGIGFKLTQKGNYDIQNKNLLMLNKELIPMMLSQRAKYNCWIMLLVMYKLIKQ